MSFELADQIARIEPGGHLCLFYEKDPAEQMAALTPFIRDGLRRNEQFIYIADDQTMEELTAHLNGCGINVASELRRGRLKLYTRREWRQPGQLDSDKKSRQVRQMIRAAAKQGFTGVRFAVEMTWTLGPDIDAKKLEHWEATINRLFDPSFPTRIICQYNQSRLKPEVLLAGLHTHPNAIVGRGIRANPFFQAPLPLGRNGERRLSRGIGNGSGKAARAKAEWMLSQLKSAGNATQQEADAERDKVERSLRNSQEQLRAVIDNSPQCIKLVARDGTLLDMNPAGCRMIGARQASDVVGRSVFELIAPEDRKRYKTMHERVCRGHAANFGFQVIGLDGERHFMETQATPLRDPVSQRFNQLAITRDVTEQKQSIDNWRFLAAIVESSDDAIVTKNLDGVITSWNNSAERMFGYKAEEAIGRPVTILIPEDRSEEEPAILARLRRGERIDHYETVRRRKDGALLDISLTVSPVKDADGKIIGASKIARDITQRKAVELELRQTKDELAQANENLEKRVEERTASLREAISQMEEFSYSVSHDLRAPVRAMNGYANAALEDYGDRLDARGRDYLDRIIRGSTRMDRLILDVLTYSRLARADIRLQRVSVAKLLADIIQQYPAMQPPHSEITVREPLHEIMAHEPSLAQAISNLLSNGVKFVARGTMPKIQVWTEPRLKKVRIWIEDNGIGIQAEQQRRLFGLFERVHPEKGYDGTGIGLAIARKAVEKMSGRIGIESDGITGSSFWIELPAAS